MDENLLKMQGAGKFVTGATFRVVGITSFVKPRRRWVNCRSNAYVSCLLAVRASVLARNFSFICPKAVELWEAMLMVSFEIWA